MFNLVSGILQPIERPEACMQTTSCSLRTADNTGDPFNFGAKAAGSRSFSITGWYKFNTWQLGTAPNRYSELPFGHGAGFAYFARLYEDGSATLGGFYMGAFCPPVASKLATGKWFYIAVTQDDPNDRQYMYLYDEQGFLTSGTTTSNLNPASDTTDYFYIGTSRGINVNSYSGLFNSMGVWNKVLTFSEILQLWNKGYGLKYQHLDTGLKTNLVSWWDMDTISSNVVPDKHTNNYPVTSTVSSNTVKASLK